MEPVFGVLFETQANRNSEWESERREIDERKNHKEKPRRIPQVRPRHNNRRGRSVCSCQISLSVCFGTIIRADFQFFLYIICYSSNTELIKLHLT